MQIQYPKRHKRVMDWYAPARFGLFYHWGLFTGGGDSFNGLAYNTVPDFEAAAGDPEAVAANMVDAAVYAGARYVTLTLLHSCDGYIVMFPTKNKAFCFHTTKDYAGAFIMECTRREIKPLLYFPEGPEHAITAAGTWLSAEYLTRDHYICAIKELIGEIVGVYGNKIAGFWIDGGFASEAHDLPAFIRKVLPDGIIIYNNQTSLPAEDIDIGTTEFIIDQPLPDYNRPASLQYHSNDRVVDMGIPGDDYNEDIPTCNSWWYQGEMRKGHQLARFRVYEGDRFFLLRQMVSSLGQRGQWNFQPGIGPMIDGTIESGLRPSLNALHEFFSWGSEAIYGTTGGIRSFIKPGALTPGGFYSVTQKIDNPRICYILITSAAWSDKVTFHCNGIRPYKVINLKDRRDVEFTMTSGITISNMDWNDVDTYGVKVLKVEF